MYNSMVLKVGIQHGMKVFSAIVCPKNLDACLELCLHHIMEVFKYSSYFQFLLHKKYPCDPCVIINEGDKPSRASNVADP